MIAFSIWADDLPLEICKMIPSHAVVKNAGLYQPYNVPDYWACWDQQDLQIFSPFNFISTLSSQMGILSRQHAGSLLWRLESYYCSCAMGTQNLCFLAIWADHMSSFHLYFCRPLLCLSWITHTVFSEWFWIPLDLCACGYYNHLKRCPHPVPCLVLKGTGCLIKVIM